MKWSDIDDFFFDMKIEVFGFFLMLGICDVFVEIVMDGGVKKNVLLKEFCGVKGEEEVKVVFVKFEGFFVDCQVFVEKKWKGKDVFKCMVCMFCEDGVWVDVGENDNVIVGILE